MQENCLLIKADIGDLIQMKIKTLKARKDTALASQSPIVERLLFYNSTLNQHLRLTVNMPFGYLDSAPAKLSKPIKTVLTDDKIVEGLVDAYVDEILYAEGISHSQLLIIFQGKILKCKPQTLKLL
ncbi:hypothetical protein AAFN85_16320 [Mucilaginibacter sp. CAU 1740]|uniref:hypothetical protein n=1 Tax=Mucilaginibacter sp. CAU 1740 TaxID=3140365 RepID=UPI00325A9B87